MSVELGPAWITPGGRYGKGVWHGYPFAEDDTVERYITSEFGAWEDFRRERGWGPHQGVDMHAAIGTPIHALADGTVEVAGRSGFYPVAGVFVQLQHAANVESAYLHLSEVKVKVGDQVTRGQLIGLSGATSSVATAPHLHLSVRENRVYIDPARLLARQIGGPQLDRETAQEWFVSQFFLKGMSHGGTRSMSPPEFLGFGDDGKTEQWAIELLRPAAERPDEAA